jgi:hypothetical protein
MSKMRLLIVDDEKPEVQSVIDRIITTGLIEVDHQPNYDSFGNTISEVQKATDPYHLLVLDVFMEKQNPRPFIKFVNAVGGFRPFIAFTMVEDTLPLETPAGGVELRKLVFEKGGLGVLTKKFDARSTLDQPVKSDIQYMLIEKVLWFYWTARLTRSTWS